jgi:hypothetical protein
MKKQFIFSTTIALLLAVGSVSADPASADNAYFVQSAKAKLLETPNFKARVVVSMNRGSNVTAIEESGSWLKVKFNDQVGWVSRLVLSTKPPIEKSSVLTGEAVEQEHKARRRASNTTAAAATRGLRSDDRTRASDEQMSDYNALKQVESIQVDKDEVLKFEQQKLSPSQQ